MTLPSPDDPANGVSTASAPATAPAIAPAAPPALDADVLRAADYAADGFLRTRRIRLHGLGYRHLIDLLQLGREERVTALLLDGRLDSVADAAGLVVWSNRLYAARPGLGHWHARNEQGAFIGLFSLTPGDRDDAVGLGARLLPRAWGRGYALEGAAALCAHAFDTLALPRLVALCDPRNTPVPAVLQRLGFVDAGTTTHCARPALRFVLDRGDWRGVRPRVRRVAAASSVDPAAR